MTGLVPGEGEPKFDIDLYISKLTLEPTVNALDRAEITTAFAHNCRFPEQTIHGRLQYLLH